ncbi:uncharacterized protein LOC114280115 [Camellia sinensis]|uniref:uncharacterized protein LOC114280115 n=1 Tax=Camellia sinensis TaxID=4442 RepID=UPI00103607AE|nr:uncharacterized protein LOC114280115 [Camellia sinensis]
MRKEAVESGCSHNDCGFSNLEKIGSLGDIGGSVSRLGILEYKWWSEGLHGVAPGWHGGTRFSELVPGATSFPQVILTAASFNVTLFEAIGKVIANRAAEILGHKQGENFVHPNDHVNRSQSSNNTFPTVMHIAAATEINSRLIPNLKTLQTSIHSKVVKLTDITISKFQSIGYPEIVMLANCIPNTLNVVSNFPFLVIGIVGVILCFHGNYFRLRLQGEVWGWTCFFIGVAAVRIGPSYYHLKPNDATLVWDCLPMTIAFTSIVAIFIIERIDEQKGTVSILPLLLAGVISMLYWRLFDDLHPYALVQFVPCIVIPIMAILLPPIYTHSTFWLWAAGFYLLAKVEEAADKPIYKCTHHIVSWHTLKHLCAAMVPVFFMLMLAKRTIETERQSLLETRKFPGPKLEGMK